MAQKLQERRRKLAKKPFQRSVVIAYLKVFWDRFNQQNLVILYIFYKINVTIFVVTSFSPFHYGDFRNSRAFRKINTIVALCVDRWRWSLSNTSPESPCAKENRQQPHPLTYNPPIPIDRPFVPFSWRIVIVDQNVVRSVVCLKNCCLRIRWVL